LTPPPQLILRFSLTPAGALGRPVDILLTDEGVIYISDDKAGVVYRVVYKKM
jgi:glucose/arabinose dehydrogenase